MNINHHVRKKTSGQITTIAEAAMTRLSAESLQPFHASITDFSMMDVQQLSTIESGVFTHLSKLQTIYIHRAPRLKHLPSDLFDVELRSLKILRIVHTGLTTVPVLGLLRTQAPLHMVDLENNQFTKIGSREVQLKAEQLLLNYNSLEALDSHAFNSSQIAKLTLKGNRHLRWLHEDCFEGLQSLRYLDLSKTSVTRLPTKGLEELDILRLQDTRTLKVFPSVYNFKYIREVYLTYPYHCCAFRFPATHHPQEFFKHQKLLNEIGQNCTEDLMLDKLMPAGGIFHTGVTVRPGRLHAMCGNLSKNYRNVHCQPTPDAFNPCEDLMGNWALRIAVWLVAIAALLGNTTVLLVLGSSRFRMTVPKFLMCHLAVADLCMGLYLLIIAAIDSRSIGDYFNHAIDWQNGMGCKIAGALTVFARELSIFTLTVITIERWYTITYAMHLDKRLTLASACKIMVCGWLYSLCMAACPLVGISGYSKTSICLPLENLKTLDLAYLVTLLTFNGAAFWIVCACYSRMYCAIRGGQDAVAALTRSDMTVAKRMALLVFTDFACWAPIAFFGITALAGYPLIDVSKTKILLVFFYPLNSCANPYLYALLTQQYRRDLFVLLSRYGVCSNTAARYKGAHNDTRTAFRGPSAQYAAGGSAPPDHRGSVLTTITSMESTVPNRIPLGQNKPHLELLPLAASTFVNSKRISKPTVYL